jgi:uncharacterized protein YbaP (TraB family)
MHLIRDRNRSQIILRPLLAWICLALLSLIVAAQASATECPPLERQDQQTRRSIYSRGLLWRVESSDGLISHLFGTIHLSDPRITRLSAESLSRLLESESFVMEVVLNRETFSSMASAMIFSSHDTLETISGAATYKRAIRLLERYGLSASRANRLKPWAVYTILSLPPGQSGLPLDLRLMTLAQENQLPVYGLETIEEQTTLFDSMDIADQLVLLQQAVCNYDLAQSDIEEIIGHYLKHDLNAMLRMTETYRYPGSERFIDALLWRRNKIMAERMQAHLRRGAAFVAVGALHLPGKGGILDLLTRDGYSVMAID